ncbi:MAG: hypothetical protein IPM57_06080 [Oligoflexia bacterium]|nr:hypothetical protein [Oligoflexia bacterium]
MVYFDGSIEGLVCVKSFIEAGFAFKCLIIRDKNSFYNENRAISFCETSGIEYLLIDELFYSKIENMHIIYSSGLPLMQKKNKKWHVTKCNKIKKIKTYFNKNKLNNVISFFNTNAIKQSFLKSPVVADIIFRTLRLNNCNLNDYKHEIFSYFWNFSEEDYIKSNLNKIDFRNECVRVARKIYKKYGDCIWLCLSGGVDSEIVVRSFIESKLPFKVAILRFNADLNIHDISWAVSFCEANNIEYKLFNLNVCKYFINKYSKYSKELGFDFLSPTSFWLIQKINKLGGVAVSGAGEPSVTVKHRQLCIVDDVRDYGLDILCKKRKLRYISFYRWDKKLFKSFYSDSVTNIYFENHSKGKISLFGYKKLLYGKYFAPKGRVKLHGYEKLVQKSPEFKKFLFNENIKMLKDKYLSMESM